MQLKHYQTAALEKLRQYITALSEARAESTRLMTEGSKIKIKWDDAAWENVGRHRYKSRHGGAGDLVPNICLKVPTGGGKTLLAVKAIDAINSIYRRAQTGLVLWIVPTTQIYNQTLRALKDRAHPYRQQLNMHSGDRTLILEKDSLFAPEDVEQNLVVMLLMLPSTNRENKETLRLFKDRGGFEPFFPSEDSLSKHESLLEKIQNLDTFEDNEDVQSGKMIKTSLGNTLRLLNPIIILDEGHKAYSQLAQKTLYGFNPSFVLELSATPTSESNVLISIDGQSIWREGMIKLDIHVHNKATTDWRDVVTASHLKRQQIEQSALRYQEQNYYQAFSYIRPINLIQVERTGADQRRPGLVHAEDVRDFLIQRCNVRAEEVAIKSSERDDIENIDLLSSDCPIRYIITKQALQEGWDCAFAYILTVLTNPEALTGMTQLVGRVLRQPYARKTDISELDESHVYFYRAKSEKLFEKIRRGLFEEGLGDLEGRIIGEDTTSSIAQVELFIRDKYKELAGKVYLPCFVVSDGAGGWREIGYETDVLSRVDWGQIDTGKWARDRHLNPMQTQDTNKRMDVSGKTFDTLQAMTAPEMPIDLVMITQQVLEVVPNPWYAYEYVEEMIKAFRQNNYSDDIIRRDLGAQIEGFKRFIHDQRNELAESAFKEMVKKKDLRFCIFKGNAKHSIPERIKAKAGRKLRNASDDLPKNSLFDFMADDFNGVESEFALYLDQHSWLFGWHRNPPKSGYGLQGWQRHIVYPDFIAFKNLSELPNEVYVLEMKGVHLQNNLDTEYKKGLFKLCNEQVTPKPRDEIGKEIDDARVYYEVVYSDEWREMVDEMLNPSNAEA